MISRLQAASMTLKKLMKDKAISEDDEKRH